MEFDDITLENSSGLASKLIDVLREKGMTITFAESCTGGLMASGLVDVPGASDVFWGSMVSYDNSVKENNLKVSSEILKNHGAVSHECARAMAEGALKAFSSDIALSATGVAGPGGGSADKPVGTVYIGYADKNGSQSIRVFTDGDRDKVRRTTCLKAYAYALMMLDKM